MRKTIRMFFGLLVLVAVIFISGTLFYGTKTVHDLLGENKKLKQAIVTLTQEEQIGYAKVVWQEDRAGKLYSTVRFVAMERHAIFANDKHFAVADEPEEYENKKS